MRNIKNMLLLWVGFAAISLIIVLLVCNTTIFSFKSLYKADESVTSTAASTRTIQVDTNFDNSKIYNIWLENEIADTNSIDDLLRILWNASPNDKVIFHLSGNGGYIETAVRLINGIKVTNATVYGIVEGNVYSAHSYLALNMPTLFVKPNTFIMLHTVSGYGYQCPYYFAGTDRTVNNYEHCTLLIKALVDQTNNLIDYMPYVSTIEKTMLKSGHDVYITAKEFESRKNNNVYHDYIATKEMPEDTHIFKSWF